MTVDELMALADEIASCRVAVALEGLGSSRWSEARTTLRAALEAVVADAERLDFLLTHKTIPDAGGLWTYFSTFDEFVIKGDAPASVRAAIDAKRAGAKEPPCKP